MLSFDPVHIHFHIPATDPLGKEEVLGKLRFLDNHIELDWRLRGSVFTGGKGELTTIAIPYTEVEHVELVKRWFRIRRIIFRISDPALVKDIPGVDMGKMILEIDARSREEAKKLRPLIDFNKSIFLLDAHDQRIAEENESAS